MPKIRYEAINMKPETRAIIEIADGIAMQYAAQGYDLTLRQLYYRFIAKDLFPATWIDRAYNAKNGLDPETKNTVKNYKRLGDMVQKGRRAGLIDWNAIVDRTRNLDRLPTWPSPTNIIEASAAQFRYDRWLTQPTYVEVWYEKDALMGVFERVAQNFRIPSFSCRGYTSDSEVWGAAQRMKRIGRDKEVVVLHFGDHDPSGIDMTRDIGERLRLFGAPRSLDIRRLALNMDQVEEFDPPPNPAKETDSRFANYQAEYGDDSWELDALEPTVLAGLVTKELLTLIEREPWEDEIEREKRARAELQALADNYDDAVAAIEDQVDVNAQEGEGEITEEEE